MAYIGTSPSNGVRRVHTYTATAGQEIFTGSSTEGVTLTYADTNYIDVFQNGVLLGSADYTSTSGTSVVLAQGASVSDLVVIVVYDVFSVADTVSKTSGGSFDSAVTMSNNLTVSGAFTSQGIDDNADATALTIDSSERVGIGGNPTAYPFEVFGGNGDGLVFKETTNSVTNWFGALSSVATIGSLTNHPLALYSNGTERMRIDSSGNVNIGTTSTLNSSFVAIKFNGTTHNGIVLKTTRTTQTGSNYLYFVNSSGTGTGVIQQNGTTTVLYSSSSDYRLKENVDYTFDATTRLKQLKPARFNFIADADTTVDGFLAHEVQTVVPEAITGTHNEVDDDGNPVMQGIDQSKLVPLLVKTIQELEARITALESA